jgi:hypothetical protein
MIVLYNDITGDITLKVVEGTGDAEPGPGHSRIILNDCVGNETNVNQIPSFALRLCQENRKKNIHLLVNKWIISIITELMIGKLI